MNGRASLTRHSGSAQSPACMKALLLEEYKKLRVTDMPDPIAGSDEVRIKVEACGICGSDIHGFDGSSGRRVPPIIMGHEAAGVVESVGIAVGDIAPGTRVTFNPMISCGECDYCKSAQTNLCDSRQVMGVSCEEFQRHGAFAEYVTVPARNLHTVPDEVSFEHACMTEPVTVATHAINRTPVKIGDTAVVVGSGMIGLLTIQALKVAGCSTVIAVDLADEKLKVALELGAAHTLNPKRDDVVARILEMTNGRGADIAVEVVGATPTLQTAIEVTRRGGSVTLVGNLAPTVDFAMQAVVTRELTLYGSCASSTEFPEALKLMQSGQIQVEPLITAKASLEECPGWFDRLYAGEDGLMKVIVKPSL
jgi:L-iditol 2-dehydrogenase